MSAPTSEAPDGVLGIGIVGAGFIADAHATAVAAHPGLQVRSAYDRNPVAARTLCAKFGGQAADDLESLLADPAVDIVIVCTPNDTHAELAVRVAEAGKHLLLEKPITLTVEEADQAIAAFERNQKILLAGHTHRHSDYARTISSLITSGEIGEVRSIRIAITAGWLWGNWGAWVLDPARSGGHAFHNGVHLYDLAHWWMGSPVTRVFTMGQRITAAALEIDDALVATLEFANGGAAVCEISRGERPKATNMFEVVVHGSAGSLVRSWSSDGCVALTDDVVGPLAAATSSPFARQIGVLHDAIAKGTPLFPVAADARHAVAIAAAVEQSSRTGEAVEVATDGAAA